MNLLSCVYSVEMLIVNKKRFAEEPLLCKPFSNYYIALNININAFSPSGSERVIPLFISSLPDNS